MSEQSLENLRWHWGDAYEISFTGSACIARRRDNNHELTADTAEDLHDLVVADYATQPVASHCFAPGGQS